MKYVEGEWSIKLEMYRLPGMSTPEPRSYVEFSHNSKDIFIRYGEGNSVRENKETIINMIKSI